MWWFIAAVCYMLYFAGIVAMGYTAYFSMWLWFCVAIVLWIANLLVVRYIRSSSVLDML
jgi:hypothetical protein